MGRTQDAGVGRRRSRGLGRAEARDLPVILDQVNGYRGYQRGGCMSAGSGDDERRGSSGSPAKDENVALVQSLRQGTHERDLLCASPRQGSSFPSNIVNVEMAVSAESCQKKAENMLNN